MVYRHLFHMSKFRHFLTLFILILVGCTKLSMPVAGQYRATIETPSGFIPVELRITNEGGTTQLWLVQNGESTPASELQLKDHGLQATLPRGGGQLKVTIARNTLEGQIDITDPEGQQHHLPIKARLNQPYRFIEQSLTDNADVSGHWQFSPTGADPFNSKITLQLTQSFDSIDGRLIIDGTSKSLYLYGQAHGDDVYLSSLSEGRALLFKGHVNSQGNLEGQLWINSSSGIAVLGTHINDAEPENQETLRRVALPWAVPTR